MNSHLYRGLLAAGVLGVALAAAGCDQNQPSNAAARADATADRVAATSNDMTRRASNAMDDTALTTKVKAALLAEPGLSSLQIGVDTKDAVVTLSGSVTTMPQKERAVSLASSVAGVKSVVDNLMTRPAQSG